ncbi:hypothetical protein [Roseateles sp. BYS87W]|uniref:Uncharacterized protein n=1 Tax=Pelomonas baiyunensis TaxID=3299026 RepID=A0ABW7GWJ4_9BURK
MTSKPGKYSDLCNEVHAKAEANGTVVVVHDGMFGNGFSAMGSPEFCMALPQILRHVADQLEADNRSKKHRLS